MHGFPCTRHSPAEKCIDRRDVSVCVCENSVKRFSLSFLNRVYHPRTTAMWWSEMQMTPPVIHKFNTTLSKIHTSFQNRRCILSSAVTFLCNCLRQRKLLNKQKNSKKLFILITLIIRSNQLKLGQCKVLLKSGMYRDVGFLSTTMLTSKFH